MTDRPQPPYWAESPDGIVTIDGGRFHTTEADLRSFAADVVDRYGMTTLLKMASTWARLPATKGLLILIALLPYAALWQAAAAAILVWFFGSVVSPSTVFLVFMRPLSWISHPVVQGLLYVLVLSLLAAPGRISCRRLGTGRLHCVSVGASRSRFRTSGCHLSQAAFSTPGAGRDSQESHRPRGTQAWLSRWWNGCNATAHPRDHALPSFNPKERTVVIQAPSPHSPKVAHSGAEVRSRLKKAVARHFVDAEETEERLVRIEIPVADMDMYRWLSAQENTYRMYWRGRHADDRMAMIGVARILSGDTRPDFNGLGRDIESFLARPGADVRLFGGLRFDLDRQPETGWFGFPHGSFRYHDSNFTGSVVKAVSVAIWFSPKICL